MKQNHPNLRILIIDDNPAIHQDFIKILSCRKSSETSGLSSIEAQLFGDAKNLNQESTEDASNTLLPEFEITTALQGQEGVEKIMKAMQEGKPYAMAFVDIRMPPGWDGVETIKRIWQIDPNMQVVICTAYSDYTWEETIKQLGEKDNLLILKKPFDSIAVRQLASALTKKWQMMNEIKYYTHNLEKHVAQRNETLLKSLSLMRATLESSADGVLVVDQENMISDFNKKFVEMFHLEQHNLLKMNFSKLLNNLTPEIKHSEKLLGQIHSFKQKPEDIMIDKIKFDEYIYEYYTQPYTLNNEIIGRVWCFRDITQRAKLENELHYQATHDLLTGLPNRALMMKKIKSIIQEAEKSHKSFAVLYLDLDRFKLVNDSLNHNAGDEILCQVSSRIKSVLHNADMLVRLGGDEFLVIIPQLADNNEIIKVAKQLQAIFDKAFYVGQHEIILTASIGICLYPKDGVNIDTLLRNADSAMYHAKEYGTNQYQFYTEELNRRNLEKLEKEMELRRALSNNEFFMEYQPQFDLKTEKLISVEALIRWHHPAKGIVYPIDFIRLAEETGLIVPIGEWVIRTACKQNKQWQEQGYPPIRVAVNITTKQFRTYNLVKTIDTILKEVGLASKYLELELTENMIINNTDMIKTINDLRHLGVQIVLDDFGTGYSSLNYLREIPVDRIKIDQSYVQNIGSDRGDGVIIQAIVAMAKSLNLEILAEGVENISQLNFLKSLNCGEVSGFYLSKPLSSKDCENLFKNTQALLLNKEKI